MLQYIINSAAIWLLGLLAFDLLLRNEANHSFKRFYLLCIIFAGMLIPLWSWDYNSVIYSKGAVQPAIEQSAAIKQTIVAASEPMVLGWEQWLLIIYILGGLISLTMLLSDVIRIVRLYNKSTKSKDGIWTVVETGKAHSPFSAFRYVFISNRDNYSDEELGMILLHEEQHGHLLHFVDVLVTRITATVFWFNPIIYILEKRLLLVHEYQADKAITSPTSVYGKFLVEQSVLSSAPVLAHSFIRSPLKKRIVMLTKKTTNSAKTKQLILLPVVAISFLLFTQNAFSWTPPKRDGNKVTYKGNIIEYALDGGVPDTVEMVDPLSGEMSMILVKKDPAPMQFNGEPIYYAGQTVDGKRVIQSNFTTQGLKVYLISNIKEELLHLGDSRYAITINDIVLDKEGKVVYFEYGGITTCSGEETLTKTPLGEDLQKELAQAIGKLIDDMPAHRPAQLFDGEEVNSNIGSLYGYFTIKDHKLVSM